MAVFSPGCCLLHGPILLLSDKTALSSSLSGPLLGGKYRPKPHSVSARLPRSSGAASSSILFHSRMYSPKPLHVSPRTLSSSLLLRPLCDPSFIPLSLSSHLSRSIPSFLPVIFLFVRLSLRVHLFSYFLFAHSAAAHTHTLIPPPLSPFFSSSLSLSFSLSPSPLCCRFLNLSAVSLR